MADISRNWTIAGGVLLAGALGLHAAADDRPGYVGLPSEGGALPAAVPPAPYDASAAGPAPEYGPRPAAGTAYCPPATGGFLSRRWACFKARQQASHWGYPEEFERPPAGSAMRWNLTAQIANGRPARMTLYQYDFIPGSDRLKPRGRTELARIAASLPSSPFPLLIEPTPESPELDEARRQSVWRELSSGAFPVPIERVALGRPRVRGLDEFDSQFVERNRLNLAASRGVGAGGAGGGAAPGGSAPGSSSGASSTGR